MKRVCFLILFVVGFVRVNAEDMPNRYKKADSYVSKIDSLCFYNKINVSPIGESAKFWYMVNTPNGLEYFVVDAAKRSKNRAFDQKKIADIIASDSKDKIDPYRLKIINLTFTDDGKYVNFDFGKFNYKVDLKSYKSTKLPINEEQKSQRYWGASSRDDMSGRVKSPDGKSEAYIYGFNIWIKNVETGESKQYTFDGSQGEFYSSNFRWSSDSKRVASHKVEPVPVHQLYMIESSPKDQFLPKVHTRDYAKPGDALTLRFPVLTDIEKGTSAVIEFKDSRKQFGVTANEWSDDGSYFTFAFNARGHQEYIVYKVDAISGNCTPIIEEISNTFVYYNRLFRFNIESKGEIVWISERDGWRHLYLYDSNSGEVKKQLTKGEWIVKNVVRVDENRREIVFIGCGRDSGEDPYLEKYYLLNMDSGEIKPLTPENGSHKATFSADYSYFVDTYSRVDKEPITVLRDGRSGEVIMEIERCDISKALEAGWRYPEVFSAKGRDGKTDIWGIIKRPSDFDSTKTYPVIEYIYAGPHDSFVPKTFSVGNGVYPSALVELGFIVVQIDGMGTANRSKAFHDVAWKNLKDAGFPDRIAWMKQAAKKYPQMDINKVGIYGTSAGGQSTMSALLFHPEFYKVGVSACGCHDNRVDKIWWNEQWMGYPIEKQYSESSNVDNAYRLKGRLLLVVGELDDNVDPSSTLQVVNALMKAGKDFEYIMVPGMGHSSGNDWVERKRKDFFIKHLMNIEPTDWNK